jgi:hypothetical protein
MRARREKPDDIPILESPFWSPQGTVLPGRLVAKDLLESISGNRSDQEKHQFVDVSLSF